MCTITKKKFLMIFILSLNNMSNVLHLYLPAYSHQILQITFCYLLGSPVKLKKNKEKKGERKKKK